MTYDTATTAWPSALTTAPPMHGSNVATGEYYDTLQTAHVLGRCLTSDSLDDV